MRGQERQERNSRDDKIVDNVGEEEGEEEEDEEAAAAAAAAEDDDAIRFEMSGTCFWRVFKSNFEHFFFVRENFRGSFNQQEQKNHP